MPFANCINRCRNTPYGSEMVLALLIYEEKMWIVLVTCSAHQNVHRKFGKPNEYQKKFKNFKKFGEKSIQCPVFGETLC